MVWNSKKKGEIVYALQLKLEMIDKVLIDGWSQIEFLLNVCTSNS